MEIIGITLVALVVTIVVLLILAGVTITYVMGDNGIIKLAQDAKDKTEQAKNEEQVYLGNLSNMVNQYSGTEEKTEATALEINSIRARIAKDYTRWLTATAMPIETNQSFEWSSSDTSIATVDDKGVITAKKAGTTIITVKTKDGSNLSKTCEVTVVENAPDVATLTDYQTKNTVAKDENGNLITVPGDFKVLTSEGTKVTEGIVIQDREENEFVWVPVDSVSTGMTKPADDIRLGRYDRDAFKTKNLFGNYVPKQDADNYTQVVEVEGCKELTNDTEHTTAKDLGAFVTKTKANGGYYFGRYEASKGSDGKAKTQYDKAPWNGVTQPEVATKAREMYNNSYIESDLINSYSWDTTIIFIQKYSENAEYYDERLYTAYSNTGTYGDEVCNIHDMATGLREASTELKYNSSTYEEEDWIFRGRGKFLHARRLYD